MSDRTIIDECGHIEGEPDPDHWMRDDEARKAFLAAAETDNPDALRYAATFNFPEQTPSYAFGRYHRRAAVRHWREGLPGYFPQAIEVLLQQSARCERQYRGLAELEEWVTAFAGAAVAAKVIESAHRAAGEA